MLSSPVSVVKRLAVASCLLVALIPVARAQQPHIGSLYPGGASAGSTVDVQIKGGNLIGVHGLLIGGGPGLSGAIVGGANAVDESARPVFQSKCTTCHEARSPENRSMSPEQWADTVKRMITQHSADIAAPDRDKIVAYLQGMARVGQISLRLTVAPNAAPGLREVRLVTDHGASSAVAFEVGAVPEIQAPVFKTGKPDEAATVKLPIAVNGILAQSGERDWFRFTGKKGQRLTFNLKAERLNAESAAFFFPTLHLYAADGHEIAKNLGKYGVDPFIDAVLPADGDYLVEVHDLLWHGNPASVYRLTMGEIPADGILSPGWAKPGATVSARLIPAVDDTGDATVATTASSSFSIRVPASADGMTTVATPAGEAPLLVRNLPDGGGPNGPTGAAVALPALFRGGIAQPGQADTFAVHAPHGGMVLELYAQRLGSPLHGTVTVKNSAGDVVAQQTAEGDADFGLPNAFPRAGDYTVEVTDADGKGGPGYLYCLEAGDRSADMELTATPDVANISPGYSMSLMVKMPRRRSIPGPITFTVSGLPAGVTASSAVMMPDMTESAIVLTAAPTAAGGSAGLISVEAHADAPPPAGKTPAPSAAPLSRAVAPVELYSVNNNQVYIPRTTLAVGVQAVPPPFRFDIAGGLTKIVVGDKKEIQLPITVERLNGYKGPLFLSCEGLPDGVSASQGTYNLAPNETKTTIVLRINPGARFFKDKPIAGVPPVTFAIAGFQASINNDFIPTLTSAPITITP